MRAKLYSIHTSEADDLDSTSKLSSTTRSDSAVEYISSLICISGMKEVDSAPKGQTATIATISSRQGRKSHEQPSQQEQEPANEGGAHHTGGSSWQNAQWK